MHEWVLVLMVDGRWEKVEVKREDYIPHERRGMEIRGMLLEKYGAVRLVGWTRWDQLWETGD